MHSIPELCQLTWEEFGPNGAYADRKYSSEDVRKWLLIALYRWSGSQWKRYCSPQGSRHWRYSLMTQTDIRWPVVADISFWTDAVKAHVFK